MTSKEEARAKAKAITELMAAKRKEHPETAKATQEIVKHNNATRKVIKKALKAGPHTIPQLATEIDMPETDVFWHVAAMLKYGAVIETGLEEEDEEYYMYALSEVKK
ncbi:MAG: hypothetical protein B5M51_01505 [Anaerolinea sp. 4484_236]|nr:MAG: hypothetical protein B5M51_01505 [Anaerolinea sp. 4484_236]